MKRHVTKQDSIDPETIQKAIAEKKAKRVQEEGLEYVRFRDDFHNIFRGTIVLPDRVLPIYPSIGRIFMLEAGLRRNFSGRIYAEEKIDGYNVRLARIGERIFPFTRGGYICPFTLDRLNDLGDFTEFFDAHPDRILCAETAGPGAPYNNVPVRSVSEDVRLFVFDVLQPGASGFLPLRERDQILERFALPRAPLLGVFSAGESDLKNIRKEITRLHREGGEGIVFKPPGEGVRVKYVTPSINLADIIDDAYLLDELPGEFFTGRMVRIVLGLEELGLQAEEERFEAELGRGLLREFRETLRTVQGGGTVARRYSVKMRTDEAADKLLLHLNRDSRQVRVEEIKRERRGDFLYLEFDKIYRASSSRLRTLLEGGYVID